MTIEAIENNAQHVRRPYRAPELHIILDTRNTAKGLAGAGADPTSTPPAVRHLS